MLNKLPDNHLQLDVILVLMAPPPDFPVTLNGVVIVLHASSENFESSLNLYSLNSISKILLTYFFFPIPLITTLGQHLIAFYFDQGLSYCY